jgi:hypothetical protein
MKGLSVKRLRETQGEEACAVLTKYGIWDGLEGLNGERKAYERQVSSVVAGEMDSKRRFSEFFSRIRGHFYPYLRRAYFPILEEACRELS